MSLRHDGPLTTAIVLAGGLGTRLRSVVSDVPKPMAPILGRPFLEHQLDYWISQGITRFILSVGFRAEIIRKHFGDNYRGASISYAVEDMPLGTGGAALHAAHLLDIEREFLLLNGDTFFEMNLQRFLSAHRDNQAAWSIALFHANESGRYMGLKLTKDGRVEELNDGSCNAGDLANAGVYIVQPSELEKLRKTAHQRPLSLEAELLPILLKGGARVFGCLFDGSFIDIGVPADYARASMLIKGQNDHY